MSDIFMKNRDWAVTRDGDCLPCESPRDWDLLENEYRLYRFLCEVEDIILSANKQKATEESFLTEIRRLVRQLVLNSYWIQSHSQIDAKSTSAIFTLYEEPGLPMTVQTEISSPGVLTPIHNHGTWGTIAILKGRQKNTFWKRVPSGEFPNKIERAGERILAAGEIISFDCEAIHQVEAVGEEPTVTFNLYGETDGSKRFKFDPIEHSAKHF